MKNSSFISGIAALILLLLTGCQGTGSASAEQAAALQFVKNPPAGAVIDPGSIEVLQSQPFEGSTYVVLSYERMWNNRDEACLMMTETHHEPLFGWIAGSGAGACAERGSETTNASDPLHLSGGIHSRADQKRPPISHVLGRVNDPAIVKVRVVWKDGQSQEAQVVGSSFVIIRAGGVGMKSAEGLNSENTVVYTIAD